MRFLTKLVLGFALAGIGLVGGVSADAGDPLPAELDSLILYVPTPDLETRMGSDPAPLTTYIKALEKRVASTLQGEKKPKAKGLLVAVGIKGGKKARVWCEAADGSCPPELLRKVEAALAKEESIPLRKPPMAFGMKMKLWGQRPKEYPEFPKAWEEAAKKSKSKVLIPPDELFSVIWPDTGKEDSTRVPSPGFVYQMLEPMGGEIQRPKDWFYMESHHPPSYTWILSREDASKARYATGMRIQMIVGVKEKTGKPPKEFILDFVKRKRGEVDHVVKSCPEKAQGLFSRICLETEEGPHHILYSLFWGTEADLVVVSISGTTKELWETYAPTFDNMSDFKLLDMEHLKK